MNEKLQNVVDCLPIIKGLYNENAYLTVVDDQEIVMGYLIPDYETPTYQIGDKMDDPTGATSDVIRIGYKKHNVLPKEVMGKPFEGDLVPIKEGGQVVGVLICSYPAEDKERMNNITDQFEQSVAKVNRSIKTVSEGFENLSTMLSGMNERTVGIEDDVNEATKVVGKISSNASHSNILALNASIEAARSGEFGRGFSVVATEMGKLAKDSGDSAGAIKNTLGTIASHLSFIVETIKNANEIAQENMDSINKIKDILDETTKLSSELKHTV